MIFYPCDKVSLFLFTLVGLNNDSTKKIRIVLFVKPLNQPSNIICFITLFTVEQHSYLYLTKLCTYLYQKELLIHTIPLVSTLFFLFHHLAYTHCKNSLTISRYAVLAHNQISAIWLESDYSSYSGTSYSHLCLFSICNSITFHLQFIFCLQVLFSCIIICCFYLSVFCLPFLVK